MEIVYKFLVDFARPQKTNELIVIQGDHLTRVPLFILMNDGKKLDVSEVDGVAIDAVLPSGAHITAETELLTDEEDEPINQVLYRIPSEMTSVVGKTTLMISLYKAATETEEQQVLHSFEFYINTRNELTIGDEEESDAYAGLRDLLERAAAAVEVVEQMVQRTALPNPFPLRIFLEGETINYDGSVTEQVDFGNIISRLEEIEEAFPDGCSRIAAAITANGVATSATASVATMVENIGNIRADGDLTDTKYAPTGKTWWAGKTKKTGTGTNYGTVTLTPTGNTQAVGQAGYYERVIAEGGTAFAAGQSSVQANPNAFGLYTAEQLQEAQRSAASAGAQDILDNPNAYNLYTQAQYNNYGSSRYTAGYNATRSAIVTLNGEAWINGNVEQTHFGTVGNVDGVPDYLKYRVTFANGSWSVAHSNGLLKSWMYNRSSGNLVGDERVDIVPSASIASA